MDVEICTVGVAYEGERKGREEKVVQHRKYNSLSQKVNYVKTVCNWSTVPTGMSFFTIVLIAAILLKIIDFGPKIWCNMMW